MPEWCNGRRCSECGSHAIVSGKLDCNYMNRLGLSQPTVKTFLDTAPSEENIEKMIKDEEARAEAAKEQLEKLKKLKDQYGGGEKKDANVS